MGLGSERRAVRASLSGREPATGIGLRRGVTLLLWAHGVGVHADAPAHSFPTNADARGEAVRTMPRTLACYPHDRMTAGGSRAITKYITSMELVVELMTLHDRRPDSPNLRRG